VSDRYCVERFAAVQLSAADSRSSGAEYRPPAYGQAAAIYWLYQAGLVNAKAERSPPRRRPRRGKLAQWFDAIGSVYREPAFARI